MGFEVASVPTLHVVKGKAKPPAHLSEWSTSLDIEDLPLALAVVGSVMTSGFGPSEVAKVTEVVESMKVDQTRWFRSSVSFLGEASELWVGIFLDDVDAPDVYVMAVPSAVSALAAAWQEREADDDA